MGADRGRDESDKARRETGELLSAGKETLVSEDSESGGGEETGRDLLEAVEALAPATRSIITDALIQAGTARSWGLVSVVLHRYAD